MTQSYSCGCTPPTYCPTHAGCDHDWRIFNWTQSMLGLAPEVHQCYRCKAWRSVTLDARATPTRSRT